MGKCVCVLADGNTGITTLQETPKKTVKSIFVPTFKADGTRNSIALSDFVNGVLPQSFIDDKVQHANVDERWYPTPNQYLITAPAQADDPNTTFGQVQINVETGVKSVLYTLAELEAVFTGKLDALACVPLSEYTVDECGGMEGVHDPSDKTIIYPKPINHRSFGTRYVDAFETNVAQLTIGFQYSNLYKDEERVYMPAATIEESLLLNYEFGGLKDIIPVASGIIATAIEIDANTCFGGPDYIKVLGLEATDFAVTDNGVPVAISTAVEGPDGHYVITFTSTPAATLVLSGTAALLAKGYDLEPVTFVTP